MYQIKRSEVLSETLQIEYHGKFLEVKCEMNVAKKMQEYKKASRSVNLLIEESRKGTLDDPKKLGEAITALFILTFGEAGTKDIVDFYDDDYISMLLDVMPFFNDVVTPMFNDYKSSKIKQFKKNAKRRKIFR